MQKTGLKEKTMANLFWKFLERSFAQGVSTVVAVILARVLMPADYGVVTVVLIFIHICDRFISEGFASALIQKKDADQTDFSSMFYASVVLSTVLYFFLFAAAPLVSNFFGSGYELLVPVLRVLCLRIPVGAVNAIQQAYVSRHMMFREFFRATAVGTFLSAFVGIGMALKGMGSWALVAQYLSNAVIDTWVLWMTVRWRPARCFSLKRVRGMFSFGGKLMITSLVDSVCEELRSIVIGNRYSPAALVYYNKGNHFPQLIVHNMDSSLMAVLYPVMSGLQNNKIRLREVAAKSVKLSTYVIFPCMLGFATVAEPFILLLLTDKWLPSLPYIRIFCMVYAFYPIYTANLQAIKALGRSDAYMITDLLKKLVGIICLVVTAPFGVYWIAMGLLLSKLILYVINGISAKVVLGYGFGRQILDILPNALLSAAMCLGIGAVPCPADSHIAELAIKVLAGGVIYIGLSVLTGNENFFTLWDMTKRKITKIFGEIHLKHTIKCLFRTCRTLRCYSGYLSPGKYKVNDTGTIIYRQDMESLACRESGFLYKIKLSQRETNRLDKLISKVFVKEIKGGKKKFDGQMLVFTSSDTEIKIFDDFRHKIITIYRERKTADRILQNRLYWAAYFPVADFEPVIKNSVLMESMIKKQDYNSEKIFEAVCLDYITYVKLQHKKENGLIQKKCNTAALMKFLGLLGREADYEKVKSVLETAPFCIAHGDLWTSNILFDGSRHFYVDFENMGSRVFFFDLLMYIFSDYYLNKRDILLSRFLCGTCDTAMEALFLAAGYPYEKEYRLFYLEAVLFLLFTERWDNSDSHKVVEDIRKMLCLGEEMMRKGLREALERLFAGFNAGNIRYCVLRDFENIHMINMAEDIDISVMEADQAAAERILEEEGWMRPLINPNTFSHTQYYKWDSNKMLKLDVLWGLYFADGSYRMREEVSVYRQFSVLDNSPVHIPSFQEGLELLILHLALDKKEISRKNMAQLKYLYRFCKGKKSWAVPIAEEIISQGKEEWHSLRLDAGLFLAKGVVEETDTAFWQKIRRSRIQEWEEQTGRFGVAVVGVDGTGKSTLVNMLHAYYGSRAVRCYMGFRAYATIPARLFAGEHKLRVHFKILGQILYLFSTYYEMKKRLYKAFQNRDKLILFDRYVWEANDNMQAPLPSRLSEILFKKHFPGPAGVIYLHCPVRVSLLRKNDICDEEKFGKMKQKTDAIYKNHPNTLVIDTDKNSPSEVKKAAIEYICKLSQGRYR